MNITLYSNNINEYLKCDNVIDYNNKFIAELSEKLYKNSNNDLDFIKKAY